MNNRKKRTYLVGRNYPNTLGLGKSHITVKCVRAEDLETLPPTMMEVVRIRAHNMKEAKAIFIESHDLALRAELDIGPIGATRLKKEA